MFIPDWTFVLLIPAVLLALYAQIKVKSTYSKYAEVGTRSGLSGAEVAQRILLDADIQPVNDPGRYPNQAVCGLEAIPGELTDHYDPRDRTLRLSQPIYSGRSISALGIAAHEVGHAIQHARSYGPMALRSFVYPVSSFGSWLAWPLFLIGFVTKFPGLMTFGILLFSAAVLFTLITLPVEFNASSRALKALSNGGYLTDDELSGARSVLRAAALTYVAAAAMAILQLVRLILLSRRN